MDVRKWTGRIAPISLLWAARLMRRILVDHPRARNYQKRGGGAVGVTRVESLAVTDELTSDLIALDDALDALASLDERKSRVVDLRFFGGLSVEESAMALKVSPETITRDWNFAKSWLRRELHRTRTEHA